MNFDPTLLQPYATALGDAAIDSLVERELIRSVDTPTFDAIDADILSERVAGTVGGLTHGDAWLTAASSEAAIPICSGRAWSARPTATARGSAALP